MNPVIAVGLFDGVHRGHQALLKKAALIGESLGLPVEAITFDGLESTKKIFLLNTPTDRIRLLESLCGIRTTHLLPFVSSLKRTRGEDFFYDTLIGQYHAGHLVIGENFIFGSDRIGSAELVSLCDEAGIGCSVLPLTGDGDTISSTRIRNSLSSGRIEEANDLLGHPHTISGIVEHGRKVGRTLGFPTINQTYPANLIPMPRGVYLTYAYIDGDHPYPAISNLGIHPTFGDDSPEVLETHLLTENRSLYGQMVTLEFLTFLRPEMRFSSPEALKAQIDADTKKAVDYFQITN
ncbi:MAG: riboflavin biosynthesis protein RibF [Clostridia bacterium]|nr:riboflavin biosynthesis protein RibF [Clostridia bacterium]